MRRVALFSLMALLMGCSSDSDLECNWVVMGTTASVKWRETASSRLSNAPARIREDFAAIEKCLNAHDQDSELSRLARLSDAEILARCDARVRPCYEAAFHLRDQTGGIFNPRWRGPETMDLGAIAKGYAVDYSLRNWSECSPTSPCRMLVDLGGNLKAVGTQGWKVGIKDGDAFQLEPGQACATSATYFRGDHIKNGTTGKSVSNDIYSVTVIHPSSAMLADGLSTTLFIMGREKGEAFLSRHYPEARAIWITK